MKYSFKELVDIPRLQELTDELYVATGIPSAIITTDGEVLTGSGWQRICTQFHRMHPVIGQECVASDSAIRKALDTGEPYVMYRCPRGLVDASSPVILEGEHVANVFVGQFFTEPPDERTERFFREQARHFGLDEEAYLAAYREVPVLPEPKFRSALSFLATLARLIAGTGLARLREMAAAAELREANRFGEEVIRDVQDGLIVYGSDLRFRVWNPAMERLTGIPASEVLGKHPLERFPWLREANAIERLERCLAGETPAPAELPFDLRDTGRSGWVSDTIVPLRNAAGEVVGVIGVVRETTAQHQALEALRERQERLVEAQRLAKLGSWSWDVATDTVTCSEELFRIAGRDPAGPALRYAELSSSCTSGSLERWNSTVGRALAEGEPYELDLEMVRPDGAVRGVTARGEPIRDGAGRVVGLRGTFLDITERRDAEERLRRSEAALHRAQAVAHVGSWVWHVQENRLEWSDEMYRIFGIERAQFSGDLSEVIARSIHPDDRAAVEASNRGVVEAGRPTPLQYRVVRPDGTVRVVWAEAGDLVRDGARQPLQLSGIVQDITERVQGEASLRLSEEHFRRIFDLSPVPIVLVRPDFRFERCNAAYSRFLGYEESELQSRTFQDVTLPEDREVGIAETRAVLSGKIDVAHVEKRYRHRSGKVLWGALTIRLVRDASGTPVHFLTVVQDLTARKEADEALRRSEARFRALFFDSPIAIFEEDFSGVRAALDALHAAGVTDLRAFLAAHPDEVARLAALVRILDVNEASVRTLEARSREELLGEMRRPFSEGAQLSFTEELVALDAGRTKFSGEFSAVSRTGRPMWLALTLAVQPGSESTLARVLVSFVDVTERRRAVEALRESERKYRDLVETAHELIWQCDTEGRFTYLNPAWERASGYKVEEMLGRRFGASQPLEGHAKDLRAFAEVLAGGVVRGYEMTDIAKDGSIVSLLVNAAPLYDAHGAVVGVQGTATDLTDYKRAEATLRDSEARFGSLFATMTEGFAYCRMLFENGEPTDFVYLDVNDAFEEQTGLRGVVGRRVTEVIPGIREADPELFERYGRVATTGTPERFEFYLSALGEWFDLSVYSPAPEHFVAVFDVITERKRVEAELLELNTELERRVAERTAQLEAANREMESFTYSVSHDLRAPLRAIDGYGKAFAEDFDADLAPGAREYLSTIRAKSRQMSELVDGLLALSRLGRQQLNVEAIATAAIVRTALADVGAREREGLVDIVVGELPACRADGTLLRQVFVNLLQNAFKFAAGRKPARVEVGCRDVDGAAAYYVRDNGVGFDMRYADKLFQPFQRLHPDTAFAGNGVGLAIVHRIVARHGGRVWAESAPGQGATFYFTIGAAPRGE